MEIVILGILPVVIVLILIIMEDTHGDSKKKNELVNAFSLNPYYNGRYSWR